MILALSSSRTSSSNDLESSILSPKPPCSVLRASKACAVSSFVSATCSLSVLTKPLKTSKSAFVGIVSTSGSTSSAICVFVSMQRVSSASISVLLTRSGDSSSGAFSRNSSRPARTSFNKASRTPKSFFEAASAPKSAMASRVSLRADSRDSMCIILAKPSPSEETTSSSFAFVLRSKVSIASVSSFVTLFSVSECSL